MKRFRRRMQQYPKGAVRIAQQDGRFQVDGLNAWYAYWRDPYHLMLTVPWLGFLAIVSSIYVLLNGLFAEFYVLGGDVLEGARPGSFEDAFFFSIHTFGSIGYGVIAPKTTYANLGVTLEAITSLMLMAVVTGLTFARFSRPTARVMFSRYAVLAPHNGKLTLMLRTANQRRNQIAEAEARLYLNRDELTQEGQFIRRFYELKLVRSRTPSFWLSWNIMHPIDEHSPLYGETPESLAATQAHFIISISGMDETVAYTIHVRHIYTHQEIRWNHRFVDIFHRHPSGERYLNYQGFHDVEPIEAQGSKAP